MRKYGEFPKELLEEEVITRLPMYTLFRFRAVCCKWNSLIGSGTFLRRWDELGSKICPLFFAKINLGIFGTMLAVYDPWLKKWHRPTSIPGIFKSAVASAGVLVCYACADTFEIGNPLTGTWKVLRWSKTAQFSFPRAVGMVTTNQGYSAQVSKLVQADAYGNFEVYDCLTTNIETAGVIPANIKLPCGLKNSTVSIKNVVYFLGRNPDGIISYDVESRAWDQILISNPLNSRDDVHLAEFEGRLLLVNFVKGIPNERGIVDAADSSISVGVWELQRPIAAWTQVDSMPSSWCSEFIGKRFAVFRCFSNGRLLFISIVSQRFSRAFTYDLVSREWAKVPRFLPAGKGRQRILSGTVFLPCFSASP